MGMLQISGLSIVNASGETVQVMGVNLGGWLVMEPWMTPASVVGSQRTRQTRQGARTQGGGSCSHTARASAIGSGFFAWNALRPGSNSYKRMPSPKNISCRADRVASDLAL